jgi:hypothetical protein
MTRKIQFDIEAENKTDQAFDQAISNIMKTSDLSDDSKKVMEDLARQYMSTIQEFQNGNMTYEQTAVKMMELETQMVSVRDSAEKQKLTFTELNNIMEVGQKIIGAVKQIYAATIQPVLDYANTTQQLSGSLRITSEEASTLIGVFSRYGLSQSEITSAMNAAVKNGFQPTIAGLADLADKVVAVQDPTEQATMLYEIFGENYQKVGNLLREGGAGVRSAAEDMKALGTVLSDEQIQKTQQYEQQVSDLKQAWLGVSIALADDLLPILTEAGAALANLITFNNQVANSFSETGRRVAAEGKTYEYYVMSMLDIAEANGLVSSSARKLIESQLEAGRSLDIVIQGSGVSASQLGILSREEFEAAAQASNLADAQTEAGLSAEQLAAAEEAAARAAAELSEKYQTILSLAQSLQGENDSYERSQENVNKRIAETSQKLREAEGDYQKNASQIAGYKQDLVDLADEYKRNEEEHSKAVGKIIYDNLLQKLSIDGITDSEFAMAQQMAVALGVYDQSTADMAVMMNNLISAVAAGRVSQEEFTTAVRGGKDELQRLWDKINAIPKNTDINVNTRRNETYSYTEYRNYFEARRITNQAAGGKSIIVPPGFNHDNYLLPVMSGERVDVTPPSRVGANERKVGGSGGDTYQFYATGIQNPEKFLEFCYDKMKAKGG